MMRPEYATCDCCGNYFPRRTGRLHCPHCDLPLLPFLGRTRWAERMELVAA